MARLPRLCLPGITQHIIQRGNNRQACFASQEDFITYAHWLDEYARKYQVSLHAWVFMTNHVHLLATPKNNDGISRLMQAVGRHYVRYFNYVHKRTGTLWEGRFKSCLVDEENYVLVCQRYIEQNPVRANMVSRPEEYRWSSYWANGLGRTIGFWTPHRVYLALGSNASDRAKAYRELFRGYLADEQLFQIRRTIQQGMVLGSKQFKQNIKQLSGRRVGVLKRGPKPKIKLQANEEN
jgi:REP-associated tyrosine transposase